MAAAANLKNKSLYKVEILLLKIIPMLLAGIHLLNSTLSYFYIDCYILSYIGSVSLIPLSFLYLSSYVFGFCAYHRMFLHYTLCNQMIILYDYYIGIPVEDLRLLVIHLGVAGVFLFVILYLHVKNNKRTTIKSYR